MEMPSGAIMCTEELTLQGDREWGRVCVSALCECVCVSVCACERECMCVCVCV